MCSGDAYPQCKLCRRPLRSHSCCSWVDVLLTCSDKFQQSSWCKLYRKPSSFHRRRGRRSYEMQRHVPAVHGDSRKGWPVVQQTGMQRRPEVPQISPSTASWRFAGGFDFCCICSNFRTSPHGVESRLAWIFRALDG